FVGKIITKWANIDRQIFEIFEWCLNATLEKSALIYYKSRQINDHIVLTNDFMKISASDEHFARWDNARQITVRLLHVRNNIAHNPALSVPEHAKIIIRDGTLEVVELDEPEITWKIQKDAIKLIRGGDKFEARLLHLSYHLDTITTL